MINDPKFTAMALGELAEEEKKQILETLRLNGISQEEIAQEIELIQKTSKVIQAEFAQDEKLRLSVEQRGELYPQIPFWKKHKISLFSAASFASVALALVVLRGPIERQFNEVTNKSFSLSDKHSSPEMISGKKVTRQSFKDVNQLDLAQDIASESVALSPSTTGLSGKGSAMPKSARMMPSKSKAVLGRPEGEMPFQGSIMPPAEVKTEQFNREGYDKIEVNPYTLVENSPLSTFSVDVDTASYANMRRFLLQGQLPPKDSIRVEELINYFSYNDKFTFNKHPVAVNVDQSVSPWNKARKLVRIALKAQTPSDLATRKKNLVFLLDVSGSMNDAKKLPLLKEAMRLLVRKLKPEDTLSIVVYAGASGVVLEPTAVSEKLKIFRALDNLSAGGSTNAGAGIIAAYKMAKQNFIKGGVNRVILATDGDFNVGATSQSAMIDMVAEKAKDDIFLTVIGLGMGNYQDSMLEKISNKGNGNYAYIDSMAEANKLFNVDLEKNLTTVAKDVKLQVEFNPAKVKAYRLIGYENRKLAAQDFNDDKKDAGEMGAGHNVTALYEIVPVEGNIDVPKVDDLKYAKKVKASAAADSDELLTVKVRYKEPTELTSKKFEVVLKGKANEFKAMNSEFRFAATVASFGLKLRGDELANELSYRDLVKMAAEAKEEDKYSFREEFIELVELAKQIDK